MQAGLNESDGWKPRIDTKDWASPRPPLPPFAPVPGFGQLVFSHL